jgi:TPP-dependent pyruvate/acetoin dehydrogenase alpha subunit
MQKEIRKRTEHSSDAMSEDLLKMYSHMRRMREFEDAVLRLYHQGKVVGGAYSGNGNEATAVGSAYALGQEDYLFPMHRDIGAHFVKGQSVLTLMLQHLARADSPTHGRDGTGHYTDSSLKIYGNISHLGAMVPVACGAALASNIRKQRSVVMTYIGDGGSSVGEVHEGLMMAAVMKLPLILIVENNQYAYSTPTSRQFIVERLSDRARGYGIPGVTIDGTDVEEVLRTCRDAVGLARAGKGPTLIESVTMRMHGHAAHDNAWYVPKQQLEEWKKKDPLARLEHRLLTAGMITESGLEATIAAIRTEIDEAVKIAEASPYPPGEDATSGVYADA